MSQVDARFVKTGFWVDNTRGSVMGQTITTNTKTGNIVIALITILTTLGAQHLWNLVLFLYHQKRVNSKPANGLHRQQQALLRTLPGPASLVADWLKLWWVWRKRVNHSSLSSLPLIGLAITFAAATVIIGIFASYLVDSSDLTVLIRSPYCGLVDYSYIDPFDVLSKDRPRPLWKSAYADKVSELARQYTRDCYVNRTITPERCKIFVRPTIPSTQDRISCPFEQSICQNMSQPGLKFDTGLFDVNDYFGFNLAPNDRMKFRRTAKCALLELEGHSEVIDHSSSESDQLFIEQAMGRKLYAEERAMFLYYGSTPHSNQTIFVPYMPIDLQESITVGHHRHYSSPSGRWHEASTFDPIPQLRSDDNDLIIIFMRPHGIQYDAPVDDPLFSAHKAVQHVLSAGGTQTTYLADEQVSVIGCQEQYQFCFAHNNSEACTVLQGSPPEQPLSNSLPISEIQQAIYRLLLVYVIWNGNGNNLREIAPASIGSGTNSPLPNDQWVKQLAIVQNQALAQLQVHVSTYAVGPDTLNLPASPLLPSNQTKTWQDGLCNLQRMRSPGGFVNINVFALAFVCTFCVLVTALDLILLKFLIFWDNLRRKGLFASRIDGWIQDGVFQLQRRAYEAHDEGVWERPDKEVPVTTDGVELAKLPPESRPPCSCATSTLTSDPVSTKPTSYSKVTMTECITTTPEYTVMPS